MKAPATRPTDAEARLSLRNTRLISTLPWAQAMLDVLQRRGRSYGLLALYEESRLTVPR